ncbi:MAG: alpha/beta hydrolase-fold protein [Cyclobacteriaceae bacterium]
MFRHSVFISFLASCSIWFFQSVEAQDHYANFTETIQGLYNLRSEGEIEERWKNLVLKNQIPYIEEDSVAFLYRGDARKVVWMGDFNGWGYSKKFDNLGTRIPNTDIWILKASLPRDARVDYKILLNDRHWIVDPVNPVNQWSGVGGGSLNSEVRMPDWKEDMLTKQLVSGAISGRIDKDILFNSRALGYQVTYSVYTPPEYDKDKVYPVAYVTDGYEYMHERMGNMITVLDNLIHLEKIQPVVAIFIDHRDPINRSVNRRMQELPMNVKYRDFLIQELVPVVEGKYSIEKERSRRAVIGSALGGLSATWLAFSRPDLFGMAGIQSPAFWFKPEIYTLCENADSMPLKIFMTTGLIHDSEDGAMKMQQVFEKKNCPNLFRAVNQGHSWGNWRDLVDDMLVYLFPRED